MSPSERQRSQVETGYNTPRSRPLSPEEKRRSRQMEIETEHLNSPTRHEPRPIMGPTTGGLREVGEESHGEGDDAIRMSATSFPGQEWRPDNEYAWVGH